MGPLGLLVRRLWVRVLRGLLLVCPPLVTWPFDFSGGLREKIVLDPDGTEMGLEGRFYELPVRGTHRD